VKYWRELLLGFLLGAVAVLGFREYSGMHASANQIARSDSLSAQIRTASQDTPTQTTPSRQAVSEQLYQGRRNAITQAIKRVSPAVLGVNVTQVREYRTGNPFWLDDPVWRNLFPERVYHQKVENLGSGFIVSTDGYVVTNEHVVHNAAEIVVTSTSGEKYTAQVVGSDYYSDIALLKIDAKDLPYLELGNSDSVIIGEWAIALGNPFGLFAVGDQPSVTVGVISATNRDFDRTPEGRIYKDMVQTDAAINRGNSGGPLVNSEGQVIGMNTMIWTEGGGGSLGIGFAIPVNRIKKIIDELRSSGGVNRNYWTGLSIQNLDRVVALSMNLENTDGVIVTDVEPSSPGEKAGFHVGDVILAINGQVVKNYNSVRGYLENEDLRVGDLLKFAVQRDGKQITLNLKLAEMPHEPNPNSQ
jgi:serine protease Do